MLSYEGLSQIIVLARYRYNQIIRSYIDFKYFSYFLLFIRYRYRYNQIIRN